MKDICRNPLEKSLVGQIRRMVRVFIEMKNQKDVKKSNDKRDEIREISSKTAEPVHRMAC
jgi:hypothetical protein